MLTIDLSKRSCRDAWRDPTFRVVVVALDGEYVLVKGLLRLSMLSGQSVVLFQDEISARKDVSSIEVREIVGIPW